MRVYNSLTRSKEEFVPLKDKEVKMYVCGPTVYDNGHLGHARSAVAFDVIRKYLLYKGYEVKFVSNFTDIDDKMIKRADEEGISVEELAERIIPEYEKDYTALGVMASDVSPKATDYIEAMIEGIRRLEEKGMVYVIDGDGVYFEVSKFKEYGKLSNQNLDELQVGSRVDVNDQKKSPYDFVLWKFKKEGEPFWGSPWGEGRPGWHIECSAMVQAILGDSIDIHGGGVDLKFPHHECEIAQHEGGGKKLFSKYWLHNGFIRIDNEKMSKSLGNFFTIKDVLSKYDALVVRLFLIQKNYRAPIDYTEENLEQAKNAYLRIETFLRRFNSSATLDGQGVGDELRGVVEEARQKFENGMDNDFETPEALAALFEVIKGVNVILDQGGVNMDGKKMVEGLLADFDKVLGVVHVDEDDDVSDEVKDLISERQKAREEKDWGRSDEIRDRLLDEFGISLEDGPDGVVWRRV